MFGAALLAVTLGVGLPVQGPASSPAQPVSESTERDGRLFGDYAALQRIAARCSAIDVPNPQNRGFVPGSATRRLLDRFINVDPVICPGVPEAGLAELRRRLGDLARGDTDLSMLALARRAAEQGLGMARDPALADRYGRILWLFSANPPPLPDWSQPARDAWLAQGEAVALLEARVSAGERRILQDDADMALATRRLADLRLRRDVPGYDPARAIALYERLGDALKVGGLLSDGVHVPPDYVRAARMLLPSVSEPPQAAVMERRLLLRIARTAATVASTPVERAQALRLFFAAGAHDRSIAAAERRSLMRASGPWYREALAPRDAECAGNFTRISPIVAMLEPYAASRPPAPATVGMQGLIGPDNRMVWVDITRSSGSTAYDDALLRVWARVAGRIRMWGTARGRFTLVDFPPIPVNPGNQLSDACLADEFEPL